MTVGVWLGGDIEDEWMSDGALLTVSELTRMVKRAIEQHVPGTVHVVGEISNFTRHSSGHLYFVLKDEHSEVGCVMWRTVAGKLPFQATDGLEVLASGGVDVFERSGRYQFYVRRMEPKGVGALELAFRQMRARLEKEGLFDPGRKRALPRIPRRIAVVTSPTGAAIRDIVKTLGRRFPGVDVLLYPVAVQGERAAGEIASAIAAINANAERLGGVDVMIVGRGGGSLEDLWAFNEEVVARAIYASAIPIISAVGHEVDVSISDLVADVRAATPTAAAELAVPVREELLLDLGKASRQMTRMVSHGIAMRRSGLVGLLNRRAMREPEGVVRVREEAIDRAVSRLGVCAVERTHRAHRRLAMVEARLGRVRPEWVVARRRERVSSAVERLRWGLAGRLREAERGVTRVWHRLEALGPARRVERLQGGLDRMADRMVSAERRVSRSRVGVENLVARLEGMGYRATLRRGFTMTQLKKGKAVVRSAEDVLDGEVLVTETGDGTFESRVINQRQKELFD